jgi:hypothetical protein
LLGNRVNVTSVRFQPELNAMLHFWRLMTAPEKCLLTEIEGQQPQPEESTYKTHHHGANRWDPAVAYPGVLFGGGGSTN